MRKVLAAYLALAMLVLGVPGAKADSYPVGRVYATMLRLYDVASASYIYNVLGDRNAATAPASLQGATGVFGNGTSVNRKIKTTGSSTSITAVTALTVPFQGLAVNDLVLGTLSSLVAADLGTLVEYERSIVTFTDANNIVVDSAVDLTAGYTFRFKKLVGGTAATDGWFDVGGFDAMNYQFIVTTFNATSLDSILECRASKFAPVGQIVQTDNWTAIGSKVAKLTRSQEDYEQCRVGWKVNTDTGVNSVSVYFAGTR